MKHEAGSGLIYMDYAATAPLCPEALEAMRPFLTDMFGNASSLHVRGQEAKRALSDARRRLTELIGGTGKLYFTGGGTESDNWALRGIASAYGKGGGHIITSQIEHHAVLRTCAALEKQGFAVTYLPVDEKGFISPETLAAVIRPDTILISIMTANNEIGTMQPVEAIGRIAHERGIPFHTDAVQAFGHMPIDIDACHVDLLSASAHKLGGPKGVGLLFVRKGVRMDSLLFGGQQEMGKRAGTENIPGIVGFAKAAEVACSQMEVISAREKRLRDHMIERLLREIPETIVNGDRKQRLSNNINICFRYVDSESLLLALSDHGICASAGSACESGSISPSHVLLALGLSHETALGSLRLTLGPDTTEEEADRTVNILKVLVERLRQDAPEYKGAKDG